MGLEIAAWNIRPQKAFDSYTLPIQAEELISSGRYKAIKQHLDEYQTLSYLPSEIRLPITELIRLKWSLFGLTLRLLGLFRLASHRVHPRGHPLLLPHVTEEGGGTATLQEDIFYAALIWIEEKRVDKTYPSNKWVSLYSKGLPSMTSAKFMRFQPLPLFTVTLTQPISTIVCF